MLGIIAAGAVASLGALILGEYEFSGLMPYVTALLFGLVVAEVAVSIGSHRGIVVGVLAGAWTAGGLLWAAWISSGEGLRPLPVAIWPAMALGAAVAGLRAGRRQVSDRGS